DKEFVSITPAMLAQRLSERAQQSLDKLKESIPVSSPSPTQRLRINLLPEKESRLKSGLSFLWMSVDSYFIEPLFTILMFLFIIPAILFTEIKRGSEKKEEKGLPAE